MRYTLILLLFSCALWGQHSLDSCKVCNCKKWHRTFSIDTLTKEKVIIFSKEKGESCAYNNSNCKTVTVDGRCDFHYKIFKYYPNGQLHNKIISKGWASGWGVESKATEIIYDTSGKQIECKTTTNN